MPPGFDNFNSSCTQKSHLIMVPMLASVPHKLPKTTGHRRSKWLQLYFRLLLSESLSSRSQWYPFWNSDIPTSQSALKQSYTEDTNGQNNDDKINKPTLGSHSIFVNYCNILAYFRITRNKFKAALTVQSRHIHNLAFVCPIARTSQDNCISWLPIQFVCGTVYLML